MRHWNIPVLGMVALLSLGVYQSVHAQQEEVLLSFRHPDVGHVYVGSIYDYEADRSFLPVMEVFNLLEINYSSDSRSFSIEGTFLNANEPFRINFQTRQLVLGKTTYTLLPEDIRIGQLDYFLSPSVFEEVFGLNFTVNMMHLVLKLETEHSLPIQERKAREKARSRIEDRSLKDNDFPMGYARKRSVVSGTMLDYSISANYTGEARTLGYTATGGMEILGGDLQGTVYGVESDAYRNVEFDNLRWRYALRNNDYLSYITAGKLSTTGLLPFRITGLSLTNDPIEPRSMYETYVIDGTTEPESEVELYVNERITDYARANELGYYRFDVPIMYGSTRIGLRIYTPSGEMISSEKQLQIPYNFLPAGIVKYNVQAGRAEQLPGDSIEDQWVAHSNVALGISPWLTASTGAQNIGDSLSSESLFYYGTLSARLAKQYLVNLDLAPEAFYRLTSSVLYSNNLSLNLIYTRYDGISLFNARGTLEDVFLNAYLPVKLMGLNLGIRVGVDQTVLEDMRLSRYRADINTRLGNINLRFNYRDNLVSQSGNNNFGEGVLTSSLTYTISRSPGVPVYVRGMFLRGQTQYDVRNALLQSSDLQVSRTVFRTGRINLGTSYNYQNKAFFAQIGLTIDLNQVRSATTVTSSDNTITARQNVSGSVGWDMKNEHIQLGNRQQVSRSAAAVRLFVDNNNTGIYDAGDKLLPFRGVKLDRTSTMEVGKDSILRISQLQSYFLYNMSVNRSAIDDPTLVPLKSEFSFIADPNQYKRIDIPFYRGGIVEGSVLIQRDGRIMGQGGLRIHIRSIDGAFVQTLRSFADGGFYAMDIPPGSYLLSIDSLQLGFLKAVQPDSLRFSIRALSEGDFVEGLRIILKPDTTTQAANSIIDQEPPRPVPVDEKKVQNETTKGGRASDFQPPTTDEYVVQAGAFRDAGNAARMRDKLAKTTEHVVRIDHEDGLHKVRITGFKDKADASASLQACRARGYTVSLILIQH